MSARPPAEIVPVADRLSNQSRMPLALFDVRSLAQHANRGSAGRRDCRAIDYALTALPPARQIKLYNSGKPLRLPRHPVTDYLPYRRTKADAFERIIVESHPALIGERCLKFRNLLNGRLEVAIGLETAHPEILSRINKRMTLKQFAEAAAWLRQNDMDLRVFVLVKPPFVTDEPEALHWAARSIDFAFDCGATVVSLIPTRSGNGALEKLAVHGEFAPPRLSTLEAAAAYGIHLNRGRVFADLWDINQQPTCSSCHVSRIARLHQMNLRQVVLPAIACSECGDRG